MSTLRGKGAWYCLLICVLTSFGCLTVLAQTQSPLTVGELIVTIDNAQNAQLWIEARTAVRGSRTQWYPVIIDRWDYYTGGSYKKCQFIDRDGGPNADTIGYGKYRVTCMSSEYYVDIDYRDADFETSVYPDGADVELFFDNSTHTWTYEVLGVAHSLPNQASVGIWDLWFSGGDHPRIPVTVQNSYGEGNGSMVKVDGNYENSPYHGIWSLGNHSVEAYYFIAGRQGDYYFSSWSDGGARAHTVSPTVGNFGMALTAYFTGPRAPGNLATPPEPPTAYPNPFNPTTSIRYSLPERGPVRLTVVDGLGREVALLMEGEQEAGTHIVKFDGGALASGIYYCRLHKPGGMQLLRILLMK